MTKMDKVQTTTPGPGDTAAAQKTPPRHRRVRYGRLFLVVALVGLIGWIGVPWLMARFATVHITDARIGGTIVTVSSEVAGRVTELTVQVGDEVAEGAVLARIDDSTARLQLQAVSAKITGSEAQMAQIEAQKALLERQLTARREAAEAGLVAAEANHDSAAAVLANAERRFERVQQLVGRSIASQQTLEDVQVALDTARQQERASSAAIETARANLSSVAAEAAQIDVLDRQIASVEAGRLGIEAERSLREIDLAHRTITADFAGIIDATTVDVGEFVTPGTRLLMYHDPAQVWVDANVKESDIADIRLGAAARITVDAYPGQVFTGAVTHIGGVATSQLALLPSPNPSGNFTKVTQRLPIRVSLEAEGVALRPGMMVEVDIDVAG